MKYLSLLKTQTVKLQFFNGQQDSDPTNYLMNHFIQKGNINFIIILICI